MKTTDIEISDDLSTAEKQPWQEVVRRQVGSLHFGVVQIVVHEKRVVQIERTEKVRLAGVPVAAHYMS